MIEFGLGLMAGLAVAGMLVLLWAMCTVSARCTRAEEVRREQRRLIYVGEDADGNPIFYPQEVRDDGAQAADGQRG